MTITISSFVGFFLVYVISLGAVEHVARLARARQKSGQNSASKGKQRKRELITPVAGTFLFALKLE